jgi:UDP-N-acetylglucosamine--N-acetylmuramyl-(pentapeptide) pyrophosphoryl-undecaprenol N-acetylglucosamine transferase
MKQRKRKEASLKPLKIILSGGGTGGHIFPAIAIANELKMLAPDTEFLFVGAEGKMEMEKVPAAGYAIEGLWISGLQRKFTVSNLSFPLKVISSLLRSKKIIKRFKPDAAIGTGGFASGPLLQVAASNGIATLIQEQNSFPGITNKVLAKRVDKICVAYEGLEKYFPKSKIVVTGNPVRQVVADIAGKRNQAVDFFQLDKNKKTVLVIGGSLGARTINQSINAGLDLLEKNNIQLIWQTGKLFFETAKTAAQQRSSTTIKVFDFIQRMDYAYAAADIIVSRAGAISISEICLVAKPVILVPSPNVAEDHQTKNAIALVIKNAALMVKDNEAQQKLMQQIVDLNNNDAKANELAKNCGSLAHRDAAKKIAQEVLNLIKQKANK